MPTVRVLRPFANEHHDRIVQPGDLITVSVDRAAALEENGLVEQHMAATAAAPVPVNKMAPTPATKAPAAVPARRGRPPKVR